MGLNWQKGRAGGSRGESCKVHLIAPGSRSLIAFLTDGEQILSHKLHWINEEGKAFPCLEPGCRLCPWPTQVRWYAPVLLYTVPLPHGAAVWDPPLPPYRYRAVHWQRVVLEITKGWSSIVDQAQPDALFEVVKVKTSKQAPGAFRHLGMLEEVPPGLEFDVRPALMRMWGLSEKLWQ